MAGGIPAGRLSIEIVAEIARLQADLDKAKRAVGNASADIARNTKAANDNLRNLGAGLGSGIQDRGADIAAFGAELDKLRGKYNPLFATVQKYKQAQEEIRAAHRVGAISADEMAAALGRERRQTLDNIAAIKSKAAALREANAAGSAPAPEPSGGGGADPGVDAEKLRAKYNPLYATIQKYKQAQGEIRAAHRAGAISADEMAAALGRERKQSLEAIAAIKGRSKATSDSVGSGKLAGHQIQNLAFQFQDLGIQMAGAAGSSEPLKLAMMALLQQGSQIHGIAMQSGLGMGGFAKQVALLAAGFLPAIAVMGVFAAGVGLLTSEINENAKTQVSWSDTLLGAFDAVVAGLNGQVKSAFDYFGINVGDVWSAVLDWTKWGVNRLIGLTSLVPRLWVDNWRLIPAAIADIFFSVTNVTVDAANDLIRRAVGLINSFIGQSNRILSMAGLEIPTISAPQIARHKGAAAALASGVKKTFMDTLDRDFLGEAAEIISPFAQKRAVERAKKDADDKGKDIGEKAAKAAKKAFDFDKYLAQDLLERSNEAAKTAAANNDADWKEFQQTLINIDKYNTDLAVENAKRRADAQEVQNDRIRDYIDLLSGAGKVGSGLGKVFALLTQNPGSIGGSLGKVLNSSIGFERGADGSLAFDQQGKVISKTLGGEISKIFKKDGAFVKAITPVFENAGLGMAGGALVGGKSKEEQLGSAIGGALGGSKIVEKGLSKGLESISAGLGQFAGPLGSLVGGVLGSVLGSAFKKVKWGRVDVTSAGVSDTSGNSKTSQKAALAAGNSVFDTLSDMAAQFGGVLGDFGSISVGVRHGDYRVNTGGTSLKVKKGAVDFNDDAEAAVAYAMKIAIERGALTGIRASTNRLLQAGTDLQTQLTKALTFEGVFSDLKASLDPVGAELETIGKEFDQLRAIFKEAGATADEYAQLEQLLTIKRQEALNKEQDALNDIRSRIAEVQGDEATVKAIARERELRNATSDAQRAELQRLYAIEDQTAAQEKLTEAQEAAASAAETLRQAWESTGQSIRDEINRLRGVTDSDTTATFAELQGRFNAAIGGAKTGDQKAAAQLVELSQSLTASALKNATSRQEYDRVKAETASALESVYSFISRLQEPGALIASDDGGSIASAAGSTTTAATDSAAEIRELRAELAKLREELAASNGAIASNTGKIVRQLDAVTAASGGDAVSVTGVAA